MSARGKRWLILTAPLIGIGIAAFAFWNRASAAIPQVDLTGVPDRVARAFDSQIAKLKANPSSSRQWGEFGMFLMAHQYKPEARRCFDEAARLDPKDFRWPYLTAILTEEDDLDGAANMYAKALQLKPDQVPGRLRYAAVLQRTNQNEAAKQQFIEAQRLDPSNYLPPVGLARLAMSVGDLRGAQENWEEAARLAPWSRDVHAELAHVYFLSNQPQLALREKQETARWPPSSPPPLEPLLAEVEQFEAVARTQSYRADELAARGDHATAEAQFRELVELRPELTRTRLNLGQSLFAQQRIPEAIAVYREVIQAFPDMAEAHYNLGLAQEARGNVEAAKASYREAIHCKADYMEPNFALGLLFEKQKEWPEAIAAYRRAVEAGPQFAPAHLALGAALAQANQREEAITRIRNAMRLAPRDPVPRQYLDRLLKEAQK